MKNKTLKYFSDKNKGKLKKGLAIGAGAGLGTALGGSYLINKEASDKLDGVSDNIKSIEGLTDSQRINMQKKLDELSDAYGDSNAAYDRVLGNTELERKLLENQFKTKAISQEEYNKRLGDLFLKDNQAKIDHQITPEQQLKAIKDVYNNPNDYKTPVTIKDKLADFLGKYGENDKLGFGNYEDFSNKKKLALAGLGTAGAAGLGITGINALSDIQATNSWNKVDRFNKDDPEWEARYAESLNKLKERVPDSYIINLTKNQIDRQNNIKDELSQGHGLRAFVKQFKNVKDEIYDIYDNKDMYKPVTLKDKALDLVGLYGRGDKPGMGNYNVDYFKDELNKPIDNFSSSISPIYFDDKTAADNTAWISKVPGSPNYTGNKSETPNMPASSVNKSIKKTVKTNQNANLSASDQRNAKMDKAVAKARTKTEEKGKSWAEKAAIAAVKGTNLIKNSGSVIKGIAGAARNSVADKINSVRHSIGATKDKMVNGVKNFFTGNKHSDAVSKDKALQKANASLDKRAKTANALANQKKPGFWESTKRLVSAGANSSNNDLVVQERNNQRQTVQERAQGRKSGRDYNNLKQKNMRKAEKAAAYNAKASKIKNSYQSFFFSDGTPNRFALTNFAMNNPVFELEAQLINSWNRDYDLQQTFSDYYEFEEYFITNFSDLDYYSDYLSQFEPVIDYAASMTTMTNNTYFNFSNQVLNDMRDCLILFANKDTQFTANKNKGVGTDNYGHGLYGKHNSGIHFAPETQQKIQEEGQRYFSRWSSAYVNAIGNSLGLNEQSPIQFQANSNERMQEFLDPSSNFSAKDIAVSALLPAGVAFGGTSLINAIDGQDRFDPAVSAALSGGLGLTAGIAREISNRDDERLTLQRLKEALDEKNQDKRK